MGRKTEPFSPKWGRVEAEEPTPAVQIMSPGPAAQLLN
jgi:hypothetical protein